MKTVLYSVLFVSIVLGTRSPLAAQITVTTSDVNSFLSSGTTITTKIDTATKTEDIGILGSTSWDFSHIITSYSIAAKNVSPDTTPYFSDFPSATHATQTGTLYSYLALGSNLQLLGDAGATPYPLRVVNNPADLIYHLPMTLGTSWTSSYAETSVVTISGIAYTTVDNVRDSLTVDAYGDLSLPGGSVYSALRVTTHRYITSHGHTTKSITYQILAKNGTTVSVVPADTNQPATGTINVSVTSWNGPTIATSVGERSGVSTPTSFQLEQNYPNPFNPSTSIRFSLPHEAYVTLRLYNVLGQEVAILIAKQLTAGAYSANWDGSLFPSGVYFYHLQAGSFVETKKLILMR